MDSSATNARSSFSRRTVLKGLGGLALTPAAAGLARRAAAQDTTTLTFWVISSFTASKDAAIYKAADDYNKQNPAVKINIESAAATSLHDKLVTAVKGGEGPDVVSVDSAWVAGLAAAEILKPIDEQFAPIKSEFFPGPTATGAYLGKQYAVPWYTNNVALFWNKTMFKNAGLERAPADWNELVDFGKKLTGDGKYGLMLGSKGFGAFLWFPFAWQNGTTLISEDGKKAEFDSAAGQEAWQFYADLYLKEKIVPEDIKSATDSWDQLFAPFIQERVAMMMTGDWGIQPVQQGNAKLDFGIAPLPKGKEAATVIGGYDLAITTTSKKADAAWDFLKWLSAKEQESILESYKRIPARADITGSAYAKSDPLIEVFINQSPVGRARATVPQWNDIENTILADAWDSVVLGQSKPADALKQAAEQANEQLSEG